VRIVVNGETLELPGSISLTALVAHLGGEGGPVAVERNQEVVPRAEHATTLVEEGDRIEIVHFVGGG
jgi:thiamine biosynthesis protein ThiS